MLKKFAPPLIILIAIVYNSVCIEEVVAFINAAQHGEHETAAQMLASRPSLVNASHATKPYTALYAAAEAGYLNIVILLVQHGATIDLQGPERATPLHRAAYNGHRAIVHFLVEALEKLGKKKPGLEAEDNVLHTPLDVAAQRGHPDIVRDLVQAGSNINEHIICDMSITLLLAGQANHSAIIRYLLEQGALYEEDHENDKIALFVPGWQHVQQLIPYALKECHQHTKFPEDLAKLTLSFLSSVWATRPKN